MVLWFGGLCMDCQLGIKLTDQEYGGSDAKQKNTKIGIPILKPGFRYSLQFRDRIPQFVEVDFFISI